MSVRIEVEGAERGRDVVGLGKASGIPRERIDAVLDSQPASVRRCAAG